MGIPSSQILVSNVPLRDQISLKIWLILKIRKNRYTIRLKCFVISENKEAIKKKVERLQKDPRGQLDMVCVKYGTLQGSKIIKYRNKWQNIEK